MGIFIHYCYFIDSKVSSIQSTHVLQRKFKRGKIHENSFFPFLTGTSSSCSLKGQQSIFLAQVMLELIFLEIKNLIYFLR